MGTPADTVRSKFKELGGAEVGTFSQQKRRETYIVQGQGVDEGFCRGVCLDWIRRILGGGHESYGDSPGRARLQTVRMGTIQSYYGEQDFVQTKRIETLENWLNTTLSAYANEKNTKTQIDFPKNLRDIAQLFTDLDHPDNSQCELGELRAISKCLKDQVTKSDRTAYNKGQVSWSDAAKRMDDFMSGERKKQAEEQYKKGESRRRFMDLVLLAAAPATQYTSGADAIDKLLAIDEFRSKNTCLLAGFQRQKTAASTQKTAASTQKTAASVSGHAVAVHRQNTGAFLLFDPNFGAYRYDDEAGLKKALKFLFADDGQVGGVGPIYGEDGWKLIHKVRHNVFGT
jgi:hypothetical protein